MGIAGAADRGMPQRIRPVRLPARRLCGRRWRGGKISFKMGISFLCPAQADNERRFGCAPSLADILGIVASLNHSFALS
jgi:hypothetical protein